MACSLVLHFGGGAEGTGGRGEDAVEHEACKEGHQCQLISSLFTSGPDVPPLRCVRGKSAGAFQGHGSFQWTKAVQAVAALVVQTVLASHSSEHSPLLQGGRGSLAAALDFAISKQPAWLSDMFGVQVQGQSLARSLFHRTNTNLKRPGPVVISINQLLLPPQSIQLWWDGDLLADGHEVARIARAIRGSG